MRMFENSVSENGGPGSVEMVEWRSESWQWERVVCVAGGNARATPAGLFVGRISSRGTGIDMDAEGLDDVEASAGRFALLVTS